MFQPRFQGDVTNMENELKDSLERIPYRPQLSHKEERLITPNGRRQPPLLIRTFREYVVIDLFGSW